MFFDVSLSIFILKGRQLFSLHLSGGDFKPNLIVVTQADSEYQEFFTNFSDHVKEVAALDIPADHKEQVQDEEEEEDKEEE